MNTLLLANRFVQDIDGIITLMLEMDAEIGDVWKWPDTRSCFLYALTEAAEFVEAYLLANRPGDSRNNKSVGDFDDATELFDVSMMLLRGFLKSYRYTSLGEAHDLFMERLSRYVENGVGRFRKNSQVDILSRNPESLAKDVCLLLEDKDPNGNPEALFAILIKIYMSDVFDKVSFEKVASEKLKKIYDKNLAKKAALDGQPQS